MTQLLGVRYPGESEGTGQFDVPAVTVGRQSTLFGNGPLLDFHRLGARDTGDRMTRGADQGTTDYLASGVVESPNSDTAATGLARADLDDASTLADHIGLDFPLGTERDLETARMLIVQSDSATNTGEQLTLAGLLHALANDSTDPEGGTPQYEGHGEMNRWDIDGVVAHAVRYRSLAVYSGDESLGLKVASAVSRPSIAGSPRFENAYVLTHPR